MSSSCVDNNNNHANASNASNAVIKLVKVFQNGKCSQYYVQPSIKNNDIRKNILKRIDSDYNNLTASSSELTTKDKSKQNVSSNSNNKDPKTSSSSYEDLVYQYLRSLKWVHAESGITYSIKMCTPIWSARKDLVLLSPEESEQVPYVEKNVFRVFFPFPLNSKLYFDHVLFCTVQHNIIPRIGSSNNISMIELQPLSLSEFQSIVYSWGNIMKKQQSAFTHVLRFDDDIEGIDISSKPYKAISRANSAAAAASAASVIQQPKQQTVPVSCCRSNSGQTDPLSSLYHIYIKQLYNGADDNGSISSHNNKIMATVTNTASSNTILSSFPSSSVSPTLLLKRKRCDAAAAPIEDTADEDEFGYLETPTYVNTNSIIFRDARDTKRNRRNYRNQRQQQQNPRKRIRLSNNTTVSAAAAAADDASSSNSIMLSKDVDDDLDDNGSGISSSIENSYNEDDSSGSDEDEEGLENYSTSSLDDEDNDDNDVGGEDGDVGVDGGEGNISEEEDIEHNDSEFETIDDFVEEEED